MRHLEACCFCINIKSASIAIAFAGIILPTISLGILYLNIIERAPEKQDILSVLTRILKCILIFMWISISIPLLIGAIQEKPKLISFWLILSMGLMLGYMVSTLYLMITDFAEKEYIRALVRIIIALLLCVVFFYLWLVVFSFFQKLQNGDALLWI